MLQIWGICAILHNLYIILVIRVVVFVFYVIYIVIYMLSLYIGIIIVFYIC